MDPTARSSKSPGLVTPCAVEIVQYLSCERLHHIFVVPVVLLVDSYNQVI